MMDRYVVLGVLLLLVALCYFGAVWQAKVASRRPSPAQRQLFQMTDWLGKGSGGALFGFLGCWSTD